MATSIGSSMKSFTSFILTVSNSLRGSKLFEYLKLHSTHGHHQMVNTEIRLIIFFAVKDGEALYNQQKQDWELTVAQIINCLFTNSD